MQMNSEERVLAALNREPVDRVPIHTVAVDGVTFDEVLGKPPRSAFELLDELVEQYPNDCIERINSVVGDIEINIFTRSMEAAAAIGYDTSGAGYIPFIFESKERMIDIFGRIYKLVNDHGHIFPYYVDGMIKNQKDWEYFPSLFPASFPFRTYS